MPHAVSRTKLKGGSLAGTYRCTDESGLAFIRKEVSLTENREFGFYRWFSQLKKLQRLGRIFPNLFPRVIDIGVDDGKAFSDLEFVENAVTAHQYLLEHEGETDVRRVFEELVRAMDTLHAVKMPSFKGGFDLYIDQEVKHALDLCMEDEEFRAFSGHPTIIWNGNEVAPLYGRLEEFYSLARRHYTKPQECLTHGNITLENLLYVPAENRIVFIDCYEENYIDTVYNEYSQILQSSNSYYEIYNAGDAAVAGNAVTLDVPRAPGIDRFNALFGGFLRERLTEDERIVTKLYEVSQFTRMLPFKKVVAKDKMIFFYALASARFAEIAS